jgi:hypothetical protein
MKAKQKRKARKYRSRRERKAAAGMMIQIDASLHDWLEGRGEDRMALVGGMLLIRPCSVPTSFY